MIRSAWTSLAATEKHPPTCCDFRCNYKYRYIYTLGLERLFLFNYFRITRNYVIKWLFPEIAENRVWGIFGFPSKNQFISKPRTMPNPDPPCWGTWLSDQEWLWIIMFLGGISYSPIKYTLKICKDTRMLHAIPKFREESQRWPNKQLYFPLSGSHPNVGSLAVTSKSQGVEVGMLSGGSTSWGDSIAFWSQLGPSAF